MLPSFHKVIFEFPNGKECPILLKDIEVENAVTSPFGIRLSVGTCFKYQLTRYKVSKIFTRLYMEDIIESLDTAEHVAKVHVHYIIEQVEEC